VKAIKGCKAKIQALQPFKPFANSYAIVTNGCGCPAAQQAGSATKKDTTHPPHPPTPPPTAGL